MVQIAAVLLILLTLLAIALRWREASSPRQALTVQRCAEGRSRACVGRRGPGAPRVPPGRSKSYNRYSDRRDPRSAEPSAPAVGGIKHHKFVTDVYIGARDRSPPDGHQLPTFHGTADSAG